MIKKITIEAVSIKKNKKDGSPYMWNDKKAGKMMPRTMVSLKDSEGNWYMGWSYRDGSPAELLTKGQVAELMITQDGDFVNWRFPKQEDKDAALIAELQAKLAAQSGPTPAVTATPATLDKPPF